MTPPGGTATSRVLVAGCGLAFGLLAVLAAFADPLLLRLDRPVQGWVIRVRQGWLNDAMHWASVLGTRYVIGALLVVLAAWVFTTGRCRVVLFVMVLAFALDPVAEWILKVLVHRPRPDLLLLGRARGFSFPSGRGNREAVSHEPTEPGGLASDLLGGGPGPVETGTKRGSIGPLSPSTHPDASGHVPSRPVGPKPASLRVLPPLTPHAEPGPRERSESAGGDRAAAFLAPAEGAPLQPRQGILDVTKRACEQGRELLLFLPLDRLDA